MTAFSLARRCSNNSWTAAMRPGSPSAYTASAEHESTSLIRS